jgi:DNA repair protein RadA/Sms
MLIKPTGAPQMPKPTTKAVCQHCGYQAMKVFGKCPSCGQFNTMVEVIEQAPPKATAARNVARVASQRNLPQRLNQVSTDIGERYILPISEFNRVLGGGIVPGSIVLIAGEPGAGKTTLLTQTAAAIANTVGTVLYISGEESAAQIKMRAERLGLVANDLFLLTETSLNNMLEHIRQVSPLVVIVDSIQTTFSEDVDSSPGNVAQVRECAGRLQALAKSSGVCVLIVGHVTKEGSIAGPKVLEHIVDTVLYLEGDPFQAFRLLRSVKNRFGATSEVGVFEMQGGGMIEVPNPSEAFLAERVANAPGSAIAVTMEGTRPLLVEIQALTSPTSFGNARRTPNGVDMNRLLLISAVLTKRVGYRLHEQDIFLNVVGGMKVDEPASDLAMAMALASSYSDKALPADMAFIGEVGLSGEVRAVGQLSARLHEAAKLGFKRIIIPKLRRKLEDAPAACKLIEARHLGEALAAALPT